MFLNILGGRIPENPAYIRLLVTQLELVLWAGAVGFPGERYKHFSQPPAPSVNITVWMTNRKLERDVLAGSQVL